jgi:uncharacterized membrane protein YkoI
MPDKRDTSRRGIIGPAAAAGAAGLAVMLAGVASAAHADDDSNRARRLVQQGKILPLEEILPRVRAVRDGTLIEVELEYESDHDGYVYEMELLDADGRLWEVELDATTGELIELEAEDD